jgi:NAD(P)-dependent dehydrogenase (short-subunit alcohol dehydrogenase family)
MPEVLITGAAGGLGAATAQRFVRGGWTVYAADLTPPPASERVIPVQIDVTDQASVDAALASIPSLSAVINFAGVLNVNALMDLPADGLARIFAINVIGTHRVNRASFDALRAGGGRIINISSETGWQRALPTNGAYASTKHAIEAYSDALRRELMFIGMPVVVIQPGPFRTAMTGGIEAAFAAAAIDGSPFERLVHKIGKMAAGESAKAHDPALLADVIWDAATSARPKARNSVKPDPARSVMHRMPAGAVDRILKKALG